VSKFENPCLKPVIFLGVSECNNHFITYGNWPIPGLHILHLGHSDYMYMLPVISLLSVNKQQVCK
jgi:hypothetical protein